MTEEFQAGQRVKVLSMNETGTIAYARMGWPDYNKAIAYSVVLDSKRKQLNYQGTVVPADQVEIE
mgnify:FL=1